VLIFVNKERLKMTRTTVGVSIKTWKRMQEFKKQNGTVQIFLADAAINKFLDEIETQNTTTNSDQNSGQKPTS
jgi:precorrin-4 methylase